MASVFNKIMESVFPFSNNEVADLGSDGPGIEVFDLDDEDDLEKADGAFDNVGSTGLLVTNGYVSNEDPDSTMAGPQRFDEFMKNINEFTIIAASIRLFLNLIAKSNWTVVPAKDKDNNILPRAQELADKLDDMRGDLKTSWPRLIRKMAMFKFNGFSIHEWTAEILETGDIGLIDISHRPPKTIIRWEFDEDENIIGVWQTLPSGKEVMIPRDKMIYAVDDSFTDHPEGLGLLRHLVKTIKRLRGMQSLEEVGYENDLRGIPIASIPLKDLDTAAQTKGKAWATAMKAPYKKFISGHVRNKKQGIITDSETYRSLDEAQSPSPVKKWDLSLLQGESTAFVALGDTIKRLNEEISRLLGTEHLMLGAGGQGSLALSQSKVGTFYMTIISTLQELVDIMERDWVDPTWEINGWPEELKPSLAAEEIRDEDIEKITVAIANLARSGAVFSMQDEAVSEVLDMLGLTRPTPEDDVDLETDSALTGNPVEEVKPDDSITSVEE